MSVQYCFHPGLWSCRTYLCTITVWPHLYSAIRLLVSELPATPQARKLPVSTRDSCDVPAQPSRHSYGGDGGPVTCESSSSRLSAPHGAPNTLGLKGDRDSRSCPRITRSVLQLLLSLAVQAPVAKLPSATNTATLLSGSGGFRPPRLDIPMSNYHSNSGVT